MKITSINLTSFRNHSDTTHVVQSPLTIFVGQNGAGKTSILEAIRCLSLAKSFRARSDQDVILHTASFCRIDAAFERESELRELSYFAERSQTSSTATRKRVTLDGVATPMKQLLGTLPTVLFVPEDLSLISDPPAARRLYLDTLLCQLSRDAYASLVELRKVLRQRNRVLTLIRDGEASEDELDPWDAPFALHAQAIFSARRRVLQQINHILPTMYERIVYGEIPILPQDVRTPTALHLEEQFSLDSEDVLSALVEGRSADIRAGRTLRGPHRDDVLFLLNGRPLASFGSRGERRSAILALKVAELELLTEEFGERPILLLDDIFSELDQERQNALLQLVRKQQTFITTTDLAHLHPETFFDANVVHIHQGAKSQDSPACIEPEGEGHIHPHAKANQTV